MVKITKTERRIHDHIECVDYLLQALLYGLFMIGAIVTTLLYFVLFGKDSFACFAGGIGVITATLSYVLMVKALLDRRRIQRKK